MTELEITERSDVARLHVNGADVELARVPATLGEDGLDISALLSSTGLVTVDPGFMNTASCTSAITFIDGNEGILRYRGYPIAQLAEKSSYLETAYLLIYGELPTADELSAFTKLVNKHTLIHEDLRQFFKAFPRDAHPMAILSASVNALAAFFSDELDPRDQESVEMSTVRLLAKVPTIISYIYKKMAGEPQLYPDNSLGLIEDFLRMTFAVPAASYEPDPTLVKAMELLLVLHADHEQNCSTSTVRLVGSAQANLYASVSAGINALSGPLHGGANEEVLAMLSQIKESGDSVETYVKRVKNKEAGIRLMGFGHRVYKNYDPRAAIVKQMAERVLAKLGVEDDLLEMAMQLESIALTDEYFVERKLYPNVDFYTGIIYKAMGFPNQMFTPLFALGRLPGWIAQWREMNLDPRNKIGRPRQVYVGPTARDYVSLDRRGGRKTTWWSNHR